MTDVTWAVPAAVAGTFIMAVVVGVASIFVLRAISLLHAAINSRLDQILKITAASARAEGVIEGRADEVRDAKMRSLESDDE